MEIELVVEHLTDICKFKIDLIVWKLRWVNEANVYDERLK